MATYLDITEFPKNVIAGVQFQFRLTARLASGAVDGAYAGTVNFTSTDPIAALPAAYTFVGGDAGTRLFRARLKSTGNRTVVASDGSITSFTARSLVVTRPPGWGFDDEGILPYGDAAAGISAFIKAAKALSTREVEVEVSNLVQDNSAFLAGDALNPSTWSVQRLDTTAFLNVVSVTQTGTYKYLLLCLEEFGPVAVTHRVSSSTLKDLAGQVIGSPRQADFLGITDEDKDTFDAQLAKQKVATRDIANPQFPASPYEAGTLQLGADGDYQLEVGAPLVRKLILRRLMSTPRDFFHLPDYGIGFRVKEPIPVSDLGRLKTTIEQQVLREREVDSAAAQVTMASNGVLTVLVRAHMRSTGESIEVGYTAGQIAGVP